MTHPYPGAFIDLGGRRLLVWWAVPVATAEAAQPGTVLAADGGGITVATGEGVLRLVTVQLDGESELPASTFAVAYAVAPRTVLSAVPGHRPPATGPASASGNGDSQ